MMPQDAIWLSDLLTEATSFPAGAHDDQLDPMFDAINLVQTLPSTKKTLDFNPLPVSTKW
jgi:phage terminase large subunit-like protein